MATKVNEYSDYVSKTELEILNALNASISDPEMVKRIYEELLQQREQDEQSFSSIYGSGNNVACSHNGNLILNLNISEADLLDLISKSHTKNYDTILQGLGTNEIINNNSGKIVSFKLKGIEVAYISEDGSFVGKFGGYTIDEITQKLDGTLTALQIEALIKGKVDSNTLYGPDGKILENRLDFEKVASKESVENLTQTLNDKEKAINDELLEKIDKPTSGHTGGFLKIDGNDVTSVKENLEPEDIIVSGKTFTGNLNNKTINNINDLLFIVDDMLLGPTVEEDPDFGI